VLRDCACLHSPIAAPHNRLSTTTFPLDAIAREVCTLITFSERRNDSDSVSRMTQPVAVAAGTDVQVNDTVRVRARRRVGRACDHCNRSRLRPL